MNLADQRVTLMMTSSRIAFEMWSGFRRASLLKLSGMLAVSLLSLNVAGAEDTVDYVKRIKPVLQARCFACHGVLKQKADLRLDTAAFMIKGGESGAVIKPGDSDGSELIARVSATDDAERMPPEGEPLKPAEIAALKAWIIQGAKAPADEQPERDPRDHWAFKTPARPAVPMVKNQDWVKNPIDAFIASAYEKQGLTPQRPADKRVWLRRVSIDLVGLPPTLEQQDAFLADESNDAYDKVVTRLLDSPQYGERWGRHWMDIWRYSDWWGLGAEVRNSQKHIWHWRDWIIESLNADKGYDQMLREMLAADELYPNDLDRLRASGFLARQYFKFNRTSWLDETVEHTAKAMLGLTFNCAKCHDHKYDPFSQVEYYRMRAMFEPYQVRTDALPGEIDFEKGGLPRAFDCNLEAQTFLHIRGDDRNPDKNRVIDPAVPAFLAFDEFKIEPVPLPAEAYLPGLRSFVVESHLKAAKQRIAEARTALDVARKKLVEAEETAKLTPPKTAETKAATDVKTLVRDDFSAAKPDIWEMKDGTWNYTDGKLIQSLNGPTRSALRLKPVPPADFEMKLKFVTKGGQTWKSVGITFDGTDKDNEVVTYLSAYAGGPKSQVSYRRGADYVYPAEGAQARKVELDKPHELVVRARGTLVNVIVDGQHSIAYRLPIPRQSGFMQIITYDALADFLSFELSELPVSVMLAEAEASKGKSTDGLLSVDQAKLLVAIAEKGVAVADAQMASVMARAAADRARYLDPRTSGLTQQSPEIAKELAQVIRDAVRSERVTAAAKADENVARAEFEVLRATPEKQEEVKKSLAAAKATLATARIAIELPDLSAAGLQSVLPTDASKAVGLPNASYASLSGALKTLESNLETEESRSKPFPKTSSGRRSALAKWITDPRHPLPARVAVNHMWSRHFGKALVTTLFDFGRKGTPPTHPELFDWLAVELVEHNWSMKHIHRLIVTSNTYRLSSSSAGATAETLTTDPDNRFHWRANSIRMEAQVVRDSLLFLAGELDLTVGGPSIPVSDETSRRRSLYFVHTHNEHHPFLSMFDDAGVLECYRRSESIVPQQALALENSPLASSMADKIEKRITAAISNASDQDFIRSAFVTVLSDEPSESEVATALDALRKLKVLAQKSNPSTADVRSKSSLIQALLNHNDFVTIR